MSLTELEKVAVFFIALGPERAEGLLKRLGTDAMMQIAGVMRRLGPVSAETKEAVLKEMLGLLTGRQRRGPDPGRRPARQVGPSTGSEDDLLKQVSDLFEKNVDVGNLNWDAAGLNFDPPKPPDEDDAPPLPGRRI